MKKKSLKDEVEYRLGLYFSLKSGAMYVRDEKYGTQDEIRKKLEEDIKKDILFLSKKNLGYFPEERTFKELCIFYKNNLM